MLIKVLNTADIPAVEEIFDLYWSGEFRVRLSERVKEHFKQSPVSQEQEFMVFVAKENDEVVGVAAFRKLPERMKEYTTTDNPAELYVIAAKYRGRGIGSALRTEVIQAAKKLGYTEIVFFSGDTHQDSWSFHDNSEFKRVGASVAPDGELGQIWRMVL
jgi:L-amino acid N-acyltransferase YncA